MELTPRQSEILQAARTRGRVGVDELALFYEVTPQTIRRDLNDLCLRGLLARVHGGAVPANSVSNVGYEDRRGLAAEEKRRIGAAAAALIEDRSSVILNIGTTTEQVARALYDRRDLVVITNNINVINILSGSAQKELILAGGTVRQSDGGIVGAAAVDFMRQFKVDCAVIGASALDEDGAILDYDHREVAVARAIIRNARRTILACDHVKFERTAPMRICALDEIDVFVTDAPPPQRFAKACETAGTDVVIAGADPIPREESEHERDPVRAVL